MSPEDDLVFRIILQAERAQTFVKVWVRSVDWFQHGNALARFISEDGAFSETPRHAHGENEIGEPGEANGDARKLPNGKDEERHNGF